MNQTTQVVRGTIQPDGTLPRFKTPDSIHLAAAIEGGWDRFRAHETRLARFDGIHVEILP